MRKIKFRAWDSYRKEMNYRVQLGSTDLKDKNWVCPSIWIEETKEWTGFDEVENIMQYTGLEDRNGVEIFEGDIVRVKYETKVWGRKVRYDFTGEVCFGDFPSTERDGVYDEITGWHIDIVDNKIPLGNYNEKAEIVGNRFESNPK